MIAVSCRPVVAALVGLSCAGALACGAPALRLPQPPQDLTALAQAYATPSGTVDTARLQQIVTGAEAQLHASDLDWLAPFVAGALVRVRNKMDINSFPFDPAAVHEQNRPELQAIITAQHTCQGWAAPAGPPDAGANGSLDLTAVIDDTELRSGIWGDAASCQERVQALDAVGVNAFFSGSVGVLLRGPLPADDRHAETLVQVSGEIGTDARTANGSFDFLLDGPSVAFRYPVSDGDVIVSVGSDSVSVRGKNGAFTCDLTGLTCGPSS